MKWWKFALIVAVGSLLGLAAWRVSGAQLLVSRGGVVYHVGSEATRVEGDDVIALVFLPGDKPTMTQSPRVVFSGTVQTRSVTITGLGYPCDIEIPTQGWQYVVGSAKLDGAAFATPTVQADKVILPGIAAALNQKRTATADFKVP